MKKSYALLVACAIPLVLWLAVPHLIDYPTSVYLKLDACKADVNSEPCKNAFSRLGQAGDTFGIASSLFSGLALFAVAVTLYFDFAARRSSRKPLIVCTIDPVNEISFDEPNHTSPRSVRLIANLQVKAANDPALNTSVSATFHAGSFHIDLGTKHVQIPLLNQDFVTLEFPKRTEEIGKLLAETRTKAPMSIKINAICESIEGLRWQTSVTYILRFRNLDDRAKLSTLDEDERSLLEAWQGRAAIALQGEVEPNSWKYKAL